jgi:hypothetical protein
VTAVSTRGIVIVCNAASHERRPQTIARFAAIEPDLWEEVPLMTREGRRAWESPDPDVLRDMPEPLSTQPTVQHLLGSTPQDAPSLEEVQSPAFRARYQLKCGLCGSTVPAKQDVLIEKFNRIRETLPEYSYKSISLSLLAGILSTAPLGGRPG